MKSDKNVLPRSTKRTSPYVASMVVWPAVLGIGPVLDAAPTPDLRQVLFVAVSQIGAELDKRVSATRRQLGHTLEDEMGRFEDVTFRLHPLVRTKHRGRIIRRNRGLRFAEEPANYEHLV